MFLVHTASEHADLVAGAVVAACRGSGWRSPLQPGLLHTLFNRLLERDLDARGKDCNTDPLLDVDFFGLANEPLLELRSRFGIPPKSARVRELDPYGALKLPPG